MVLGFPSQNRKGVGTGKIRKTCCRDSGGPGGSETPLESSWETEAPVLMSPGLRGAWLECATSQCPFPGVVSREPPALEPSPPEEPRPLRGKRVPLGCLAPVWMSS